MIRHLDDGASVVRLPWAFRLTLLLGLVVWIFAFIGVRALVGQEVTAIATLDSAGVAAVNVGNHTATPLLVNLKLYRDASDSTGVVLRDTVGALISPAAFTLQPGEWQIVRIKVRAPVRPGELLRLATLFAPPQAESGQRVQLAMALRIVSKVQAP